MNEIRDTEIHEKQPKHKILPLVLAALSGFVFALLLGGMEISCSFPAVIASQRAEMQAEIAALLFD